MAKILAIVTVCSALVCACVEVDSTNPYDPATPDDLKAKASLSGVVSLDGFGDVTNVVISVGSAAGADGGADSWNTSPLADSSYSIAGIVPGLRQVSFSLEGYEERVEVRNFLPGAHVDLRVRLTAVKGGLSGLVNLEGRNDHSGVTVTLSDASGTGNQLVVFSAPSGSFMFDSVPVGSYSLSATKSGYLGQALSDLSVTPYSTTVISDPIILPPVTGAVDVLGGPEFDNPDYDNLHFTRTRDVRLRVLGFNALEMMISENEDFSGADWVTYQTETPFRLSDTDGSKTVYVLLKGQDEVLSERIEGHTILDTQAPRLIDLTLGNGGGYTDDSGIPIRILADDLPRESGIVEMRLTKGAPPLDADPWTTYNFDAALVLDDLDGAQQVFAQVRDRAGNPSAIESDSIILDRLPPRPGDPALGPPVMAGNGSGWALGGEVPITLNVVDDTTPTGDLGMVVCEAEGCPGMAFGPYSSRIVLSYGSDGTHTIYAIFSDGAGNLYAADPLTFTIDSDPPTYPSLTVVEGQAVADPAIHLLIDSNGADEMLLSADPSFQGATWQPFSSPASFSLTGGDGPHRVFVQVRDLAGHIAGPATADVTLDTQAPQGSLHVIESGIYCESGSCYSNSESVLVAVTGSDNTASGADLEMQFAIDPGSDGWGPIQPYSPNAIVVLKNQAAAQAVHLRLSDPAGNQSADIVSDNTVMLDLLPPTLPAIASSPAGYLNDHTSQISLVLSGPSSDDGSGVLGYEYQIDPNPSWWPSHSWSDFGAGGQTFSLDDCSGQGECPYSFRVRAIDRAGNTGAAAVLDFVLDEDAPSTPTASVSATGIDKGPKVINADAVTVWVDPADSADPNFERFETNIRVCNGAFDPAALSCDTWGSWAGWNDSGVGPGGIQIPVILMGADAANQVDIRGVDRAGNVSAADSVYFSEDSKPPSPAVLSPQNSYVNADQVSIYLSTPSSDENGLTGYECTINGHYDCKPWRAGATDYDDASSVIPPDTTRFKITLDQDNENVVQLRAIDLAGNRSGTSQTVVTENSNLISTSVFNISNNGAQESVTIDEVFSSSLEAGRLAVTYRGTAADGSTREGAMLLDTNSGKALTVADAYTPKSVINNSRIVVMKNIYDICFGPSAVIDAADAIGMQICGCIGSSGASSPECQIFPAGLADVLAGRRTAASLVTVDLIGGIPTVHWLRSTPGLIPYDHPILDMSDQNRSLFSFDGRSVAWVQPPGTIDSADPTCKLFMARPAPACSPSAGECPLTTLAYQYTSAGARTACGRLAVGGDFMAWAERTSSGGDIMFADSSSGTDFVLSAGGQNMNPDMDDTIVFDCHWDNSLGVSGEPACEHLFWTDFSAFQPTVKVLDLADVQNPLVDDIRHGLMELDHLDAYNGKVVWEDFNSGNDDIYYIDLNDPVQCPGPPGNRGCLGNQKVVGGSPAAEFVPAIWGRRVAYWRGNPAGGYQLNVADLGSHPWLFYGSGGFMIPRESGGTLIVGRMDSGAGANPFQIDIYDPAGGSLTELAGFSRFLYPTSYLHDAMKTAVGLISVDSAGQLGVYYCNDQGVACDPGRSVMLVDPVVGGSAEQFGLGISRGDSVRMLWTQESSGHSALLGCDLDPSGAKPCDQVVGSDPSSAHRLIQLDAGTDRLSVCDMAVSGNLGLVLLYDESTATAAGYTLDMPALEGRPNPIFVSDVSTDLSAEAGVRQRLDDGSWKNISECADFFRLSDVDEQSGRATVLFMAPGCARCSDDTTCTDPPCCGDTQCVCQLPAVCDYTMNYTSVLVAEPNQMARAVLGFFSEDDSQDIEIAGSHVVWLTRTAGQNDIYRYDLERGGLLRLNQDDVDQQQPALVQFPDDGVLPGGLQLFWADSRNGAAQIYHTRIE